jgi:hypothetical protein
MAINEYQPHSGRVLKENDTTVNIADVISNVYDSTNQALKTTAQLGNIAIENVSIKDKVNAYYIKVNANGSIDTNTTITGGATEAKQDTIIGYIDGLEALLTSIKNTDGIKKITDPLPSGTNQLGKFGYTLKRINTSFTRPADTTAYTIGDAISNSTTTPTVFQLDLSTIGAVNGQAVEIRKAAVVSSAKQATLPLINIFLSPTTFTATNDNSALDIDDTTMESAGCWLNCDLQNSTASNSRVAKEIANAPMVLASNDTKIYGTLQAANAYTPVSGEKFTILLWVALL